MLFKMINFFISKDAKQINISFFPSTKMLWSVKIIYINGFSFIVNKGLKKMKVKWCHSLSLDPCYRLKFQDH